MSKDILKKELHDLIDNMEDEEVLSMLKEECAFYSVQDQKDITGDLSPEQLKELEEQLNEDPMKDTIRLDEFKKATAKWRTK
jgi:SpoVK/Ycf46/Vps4 family AAA+-type ATPase